MTKTVDFNWFTGKFDLVNKSIGNAFTTIQGDTGTAISADSSTDTLTFTSPNGSIIIDTSSGSDTIRIELSGQFMGVNLNILAEQNVSITTGEVGLLGGASIASTRVQLTVENQGSNTIYVGLTGLTTTGSERVLPNESRMFPISDNQGLFAKTASGGTTVHVKEYGPA